MMCRMIESAGHAPMADSSRFINHSLGKVGKRVREFCRCAIRLQQMPDIDEKQLPVLERIQYCLLIVGGRGVQRRPQFALHRRSTGGHRIGLDQRNHFVEMNPEKVVPEVVARAQQTSQPAHSFSARQKREGAIVKRFIAKFDQLVEKLVKMMHRLGRVGCLRHESRELYDHPNRQRQTLLLRAFSYFPAGVVADHEPIVCAFLAPRILTALM